MAFGGEGGRILGNNIKSCSEIMSTNKILNKLLSKMPEEKRPGTVEYEDGRRIGFSFIKNLDTAYEKKLKLSHGEYISIISVSVPIDSDLSTNTLSLPIKIRITFGKKIEEGVLLDYKDIKDTYYIPLNIISSNDFFYDIENDCIYDQGKSTTLKESIEKIYNQHIKPLREVSGFWIRLRLRLKDLKLEMFRCLSNIPVFLIKIIYGEEYRYDIFTNTLMLFKTDEIENKKIVKDPNKELEIFGYKTSSRTIFSYCVLHLFLFFIFYIPCEFRLDSINTINNSFKTPRYCSFSIWERAMGNGFFILLYGFSSLYFWDKLLNKNLKKALEALSEKYKKELSRNFEI